MTARRRLYAALAALLVAFALAGTAPAGAAPRGFFGMNANTSLTGRDFKRMREGGVGMYRLFIQWAQVQKRGTGAYDWSQFDGVVTAAALNRVDLLIALYGTPRPLTSVYTERETPLRSKRTRHGWKEFVHRIVKRYGPEGKFWTAFELTHPGVKANPVRFWQVWNEQNSPTYYMPKPSVREYATLLRMTSREIRQVDPGGKVVLGGMFGAPPREDAISSWSFLRRLYALPGTRRDFDVVAVHPYYPRLSGIRRQLALTRDVMEGAGDERTPVWVTEIGWATAGSGRLVKGIKGQARMLSRSFRLFLRNRREWRLRRAMWFSWRDNPDHGTPCTWCGSAGLLGHDLDPKPAWKAFKTLARGGR